MIYTLGTIGGAILGGLIFLWILTSLRQVVPTNAVHILQSGRKTVSYGSGKPGGNVYYAFPSWMPVLGVSVTKLPVSVFSLPLNGYAAYDKGRVPFVLDMVAFFRIDNSDVASSRVSNIADLQKQLESILQGAARTILAKSEIEEILQNRAVFGDQFTTEVHEQLTQWGVTPVKNIELMDIRDAKDSKVIENIMAKKQSLIEMESRTTVAGNMQAAKTAEIAAAREVQLREQEADEQVGIRTAKKQQEVGINNQKASQAIKDEEKTTAEKAIAVKNATDVGQANIDKQVAIVAAERQAKLRTVEAEATKQVNITTAEGQKQQAVTLAEGQKQQTVTLAEGDKAKATLVAEGTLAARLKEAEGTQAIGLAEGAAETAKLMAPVNSQIALAKEIGSNAGYQTYLVSIKQIEATQAIGVEQAKGLEHAEVKIFANAGSPPEGMKSVMDLFSTSGGLRVASAIEAFKATPAGEAVGEAVAAAINGGGH